MMRTRNELWSMQLEQRRVLFDKGMSEEDIEQTTRGYADTALGLADWLQVEHTDYEGTTTTYLERVVEYSCAGSREFFFDSAIF